LGQGNGGNIRLQVNSLEAQTGGQVSTTSQRGGNAGNIWVNARDRISLSGQDDAYEARARRAGEFSRFGGASSGFYADTATQATGRGGNLTVSTPQLDLSDTALLSVSGRGAGGAGNLRLRANRITLNDQGQLTAEARSGDRGNINIQSNTVFLRNNSRITTTATETASGGDINVNAQFLVGLENSDVIARAQQGRGGNIAIAAQSVLGLQPRLELTPGNDINASSQLGLNGTVQISTPNIDANTGLVALPNDVIDSSQQIADRCGSAPTNQFIITGRGGVPASPSESRSERPWQDFRDLSAFTTAQTEQPVTSTASQPTDVWVEAIGFQHNAQGQVELVATSSGAEGDAGRIAIANSGSSFVQSSTCAASVGQ
jgi:large exoprotein involved in heme utilization and adhesion